MNMNVRLPIAVRLYFACPECGDPLARLGKCFICNDRLCQKCCSELLAVVALIDPEAVIQEVRP